MAKRLHEDLTVQQGGGRASKRSKKEDKTSSSTVQLKYTDRNGAEDNTNVSNTAVTPSVDKERLSKEERRTLRRARKEQGNVQSVHDASENALDDTTDQSRAAEAERKALKRARKAARSTEKTERSNENEFAVTNDAVDTSGATSDTAPEPLTVPEVSYNEHAELGTLSQTEIDAYISKEALSIEDPLKQQYRPILSFKYLPCGEEISRSQFRTFSSPTPVQAACWPYLLAGRDVVGVAETGSGKTLAFGVPCIKYIAQLGKEERRSIKSCMVSPTRELAMQIYEQMVKIAELSGLKVSCVYGGVSKDAQRETLAGTNIIVATPGRLNDFVQEGSIDLSNVTYLVLDEADRMLDTGFEQEVRRIISATPTIGRQTLMFTATWPQSVRDLAGTFMDKPAKITVGGNSSGDLRANARIVQEVEVIEDREKQSRLIELLKQYQSGKNKKDRILVFCLYKKEATRIEEFIRRKGFPVAGIHGDLSQPKRTESLDAFKRGTVPLLVATDVAARGLDIPAVKVVINVTFPLTVEDYVHRIGRTGRAGQDGKAVTLFTVNEKGLSGGLINVLKAANQPVPEELMKFGTTVKKKGHESYGAFYKDVGAGEMKKATKITFD